MIQYAYPAISALLGLATGDALGVPVEFTRRAWLTENPVTGMRGYGSHDQPPGTWSDDSSLAFCLAESLCRGYNLKDIAGTFVKWYNANYWTPHGEVFDIGIATSGALHKAESGTDPLLSGGTGEGDNGNGSLMRTLPLIFYTKGLPVQERWQVTREVSGITHAHIRSELACFIYCEFALQLLGGADKHVAYRSMQQSVNQFVKENAICSEEERNKFHRILENPIGDYEIRPLVDFVEEEIYGSGYVLHTLESSIWCLLKTGTYAEAVLKAVNLGDDTDTTGCVTGGLAGLYYGAEAIPAEWLEVLARRSDIEALGEKLGASYP